MSQGKSSFGTLLKLGDAASPEVFTTIAECLDFDGPGLIRSLTEVTNHQSPSSYREFVPALKDGQNISFDVNWIPSHATHDQSTGFHKDFDDGTVRNFQMVWPTSPAATMAFAGIVVEIGFAAPVEGRATAAVVIKLTGAITLS